MMHVLLSGRFDAQEAQTWRGALAAALPEARWWLEGDPALDRAAIEVAVVANPRPGSLAGLPRLRLVQSLWAGVERLLADPTVPPDVPLARMVDPAMNAAMAQTALWATLSWHRGFFAYARQQQQRRWQPLPQRRADEVNVLVLGRGQMGAAVAARLAGQGYRVSSWHAQAGALAPWLAGAEVLINLLPLTPATTGLLDAAVWRELPRGAALINLARGAHVVDADLLAALDEGQIGHAVLDVFTQEPLPADHPYWRHPRVTVLPHAAAQTDARSAAAVVAANLRALLAGAPLAHLVDRTRGY